MPRQTRRDVLRTLGATTTATALAGCGVSGPPCGTTEDAPQATVATETASLDALPDDATWTMSGGNPGRTRSTAAAGPVEDVALTWRFDTHNYYITDYVALADGRMYVGGDALHALDPVAEARDWAYSVSASEPDVHWPTVARDAGVVVVEAADGLHAVDVETGERRWRYGDEPVFPGGVADGIVYAQGPEDGLHAIDAASGERRFTEASVGSFVGVGDGRAVVTDPLRAVDTADGTELWRIGEDRAAELHDGSGLVADGTVYLVVYPNNVVHAVDAADGAGLWRYESEDPDSFQAPAYADGRVVLGSHRTKGGGAHVHVLDAATGDQSWMVNVDCSVKSLAVAGDVVYLAAQDTLQARRLTDGGVVWYHEHERPCDFDNCEYNEVTVVDGALVARNSAGEVHVFAER